MSVFQIKSYFPEDDTQIFRVFLPENFPRPTASDTEIAGYGVEEVALLTTKLLKNVEPYVGKVLDYILVGLHVLTTNIYISSHSPLECHGAIYSQE